MSGGEHTVAAVEVWCHAHERAIAYGFEGEDALRWADWYLDSFAGRCEVLTAEMRAALSASWMGRLVVWIVDRWG